MRVSVVGKQFPDSLARNFSCTLKRLGHTVQIVDEDALVGAASLRDRFKRVYRLADMHPRVQALRDDRVKGAILEYKPDIVLNTYAYWHPESVAATRAKLPASTRFLFLYPDATAHLVRELPLAAPYDVLFFKDPHSVEMFRSRLGINAVYLPEACNPEWHRPVALSGDDQKRYECELTTAGSLYYYRALQLEPFVDYDLKIWGTNLPSWVKSPVRKKYTGQFIAEGEKAKAFQAAKIVLNTHSEKEFTSTNVRTFEAAGCGAFQIADWRPALDELFVADEEIVVYRSRDELKEKVDYYLRKPDERRRIAEAGCRRAHAEHTYERRIEQMFAAAEGPAA